MTKPRFEALTLLLGWLQCLLTDHEWRDGGDWFMCWRCKKLMKMPNPRDSAQEGEQQS